MYLPLNFFASCSSIGFWVPFPSRKNGIGNLAKCLISLCLLELWDLFFDFCRIYTYFIAFSPQIVRDFFFTFGFLFFYWSEYILSFCRYFLIYFFDINIFRLFFHSLLITIYLNDSFCENIITFFFLSIHFPWWR